MAWLNVSGLGADMLALGSQCAGLKAGTADYFECMARDAANTPGKEAMASAYYREAAKIRTAESDAAMKAALEAPYTPPAPTVRTSAPTYSTRLPTGQVVQIRSPGAQVGPRPTTVGVPLPAPTAATAPSLPNWVAPAGILLGGLLVANLLRR